MQKKIYSGDRRIFHSYTVLVFLNILTFKLARSVLILQDRAPTLDNNPQVIYTASSAETQVFTGLVRHANHSPSDFFHQIYFEDGSMLVGARNFVYNISLISFTENKKIKWDAGQDDIQMCILKQKTALACQNYIQVIARKSADELLVCGTNAFRPLCRTYKLGVKRYNVLSEESGQARCPYDPAHSSTAIYSGKRLFTAAVADLSGRDYLIFSQSLRTEQHDSQWLNEPNFVSSFPYGDKVYFFFRETAVENINCGKAVFSRVARVCTNDAGGARVLRNTWTSFSKARLNCSLPGEFPFYFDELQSSTGLGEGNVFPTIVYGGRVAMVYAVFNTARNSIRGAAVCAFKLSDIIASFEGPYKEQKTALSNWLPVRESDVPEPHPGKTCANDSTLLSDQTLNFIKSHPLMDKAVPAFGGQPILIQTSFNFSFSQIAVDWQVFAADHRYYDILFVGTDDGKVYKVINRGRGQKIETIVIEILSIFDSNLPITSLAVYRDEALDQAKLIAVSRDEIRSIPLNRCHLKTTCSECVALRDPYCSWLDKENICSDSPDGYQSIETGRHAKCPVDMTTTTSPPSTKTTSACMPCVCSTASSGEYRSVTTKNKIAKLSDQSSSTVLFPENSEEETTTDETWTVEEAARSMHVESAPTYNRVFVIMIIVPTVIVALFVGFAVGYVVARRRQTQPTTNELVSKDCEGTFYKGRKMSASRGAVQNQYEVEPHSFVDKCNTTRSTGPAVKQCNIFANDLNSSRTGLSPLHNNAYPETSLRRPAAAVYL